MIDLFVGWFNSTWHFAKSDFQEWPLRFCLEMLAWGLSIGCSIIMMLTVPTPPLMLLYPFWILGCAIYCWAAYTRKSAGMVANYLLLVTIDLIALARMISNLV